MGEQLINLHTPAESLAGLDCWTGPWRNGMTEAGAQGLGLEKEVGSRTEGQIKDQLNSGFGGLPEHMQTSHFSKGA